MSKVYKNLNGWLNGRRGTAEERFIAQRGKAGPDDCWVWTGLQVSGGYGFLKDRGRAFRVHRYAYERDVGPIPLGLMLRHKCHTRLCSNPAHLLPGTHTENMQDRRERDGFRSKPTNRISEEEVVGVRGEAILGTSFVRIGIMFGIDRATVKYILRGGFRSNDDGFKLADRAEDAAIKKAAKSEAAAVKKAAKVEGRKALKAA
jgi:hypothetical protein